MSVQYSIITRKNLQKPNDPPKFYAVAKSRGEISLRELAKEISSTSTIAIGDVLGVLEGFIALVPKHISNGNIVRLGEFGSFSLSISSEGAPTEDDFHAGLIKSNSLNFRPGKEVQDALDAVKYKKVV
ncbi:MAG: HU family DNA-binding protein [Bacteroidetes bacterium]|nr:HU family DNA-binding protein [Bacteroidota bacterium]